MQIYTTLFNVSLGTVKKNIKKKRAFYLFIGHSRLLSISLLFIFIRVWTQHYALLRPTLAIYYIVRS
jgi:hypothetical protein